MQRMKSPAELEAQIQSYADWRTINDPASTFEEFDYLADNQTEILKFTTELAGLTELSSPPDGASSAVLHLLDKNTARYIDYLRSGDRDKEQVILEKTAIYKEKFDQPVTLLLDELASLASVKPNDKFPHPIAGWQQHPGYLGYGTAGYVFKIETNGEPYAAKVFKNKNSTLDQASAYAKAEGVQDVAQIEALSLDQGVMVMEYIAGKCVADYGEELPTGCTDDEIAKLVETLIELGRRGLAGEFHSGNIMYASGTGFKVIDYEHVDFRSTELDSESFAIYTQELVLDLVFPLMEAIHGSKEYTQEEFDNFYNLTADRYKRILNERFPGLVDLSLIR